MCLNICFQFLNTCTKRILGFLVLKKNQYLFEFHIQLCSDEALVSIKYLFIYCVFDGRKIKISYSKASFVFVYFYVIKFQQNFIDIFF